MSTIIRTYSELIALPTFEERFEYLKLGGQVADMTFGAARYLNQEFYRSRLWRQMRDQIMVRDAVDGDHVCDLAHPEHPINGRIIVHHMNPLTIEDFRYQTDKLLNPEFLICVSHITHEAVSYGDANPLPKGLVERRPNDTCPWKQI